MDLLVVISLRLLVAHDRQVHPQHLELCGDPDATEGCLGVLAGQLLRQDAGLFPQGRHQPEQLAPVLGALADGIDVAVVPAGQVVLDDDAVLHVEPGLLRQVDIGPDPGRHDNHVALQFLAVLEFQAADGSAREGRVDGLGQLVQVDVQAQPFQGLLQHRPGRGVQLAVHQVIAQVGYVDLQAPFQQSPGSFQAQQSAADNHHPARRRGMINHGLAVLQRAEREHPVPHESVLVVHVVDGWEKGRAARGDYQLVVGF